MHPWISTVIFWKLYISAKHSHPKASVRQHVRLTSRNGKWSFDNGPDSDLPHLPAWDTDMQRRWNIIV